MKIQIAHICPELLNLYGDRGNIASLLYRTQKRGIECEVVEYGLGKAPDFERNDIIFIGGGSDKDQLTVCKELLNYKNEFKNYVESGKLVLAVCGGFELMGEYIRINEEKIPALSVADFHTEYDNERHIGNVVIKSKFLNTEIVGFENHSGKTYLGEGVSPLGTVLAGHGNNGEDGTEGVHYKNLIGTYSHGPLLPKNPHLCDYIIRTALNHRYGRVDLRPLIDTAEHAAHDEMVARLRSE